jgi:hypothetical protein
MIRNIKNNIIATPLQRYRNAVATSLQHYFMIGATPLQRYLILSNKISTKNFQFGSFVLNYAQWFRT